MRRLRAVLLGLWLIPLCLTAGPAVHIVAVDRIAYDDATIPEWGIQTPQTPSRKATFQVWRNGLAWRPLTVNYKISGSASNGVDYTALSGQVTIPGGSRFARIIVHPIDDTEIERRTVGSNTVANETVILTLEPSSTYRLGFLRQARVVIHDDDEFTPTGVINTINLPPYPVIYPPLPGVGIVVIAVDRQDNATGANADRYLQVPTRVPRIAPYIPPQPALQP